MSSVSTADPALRSSGCTSSTNSARGMGSPGSRPRIPKPSGEYSTRPPSTSHSQPPILPMRWARAPTPDARRTFSRARAFDRACVAWTANASASRRSAAANRRGERQQKNSQPTSTSVSASTSVWARRTAMSAPTPSRSARSREMTREWPASATARIGEGRDRIIRATGVSSPDRPLDERPPGRVRLGRVHHSDAAPQPEQVAGRPVRAQRATARDDHSLEGLGHPWGAGEHLGRHLERERLGAETRGLPV